MEFKQFVLISMVAFVLFVLLILSIVYRNRPIVHSYDCYKDVQDAAYMKQKGYRENYLSDNQVEFLWEGKKWTF